VIGLMFVAAIGLWLLLTAYLAVQLPRWLGLQSAAKWLARLLLVPLLLVGPLADHLVGMRQFERLCAEEGRLQISPAAVNTKRAEKLIDDYVPLKGYAVRIERMVIRVIDLDTREQVAQYKYFSTKGGVVGRLPQLGGRFTCSASDRDHVDREQLDALAIRTKLAF
jgi:hypothetical protein